MSALRILLVALLLAPFVSRPAQADEYPGYGAPIRVILTSGDTLAARCVQPAPFDMLAVFDRDEAVRYVAPVRVQAVIDASGQNRTADVMERRAMIGVPPLPPLRHPKVGRALRVGPRWVTKSFLITETTWLGRVVVRGRDSRDLMNYFGFDLGKMVNVSDHTALGTSGFFGSSYHYVNAGVRLRARRWLTRTASVEVAPSMVLGEHRVEGKAIGPGYTLQMSASPSRYVTLTAEGFTLRSRSFEYPWPYTHRVEREEYRDTGLLVGVRVGQWPGAASGGLAALVALLNGSSFGSYAPRELAP